MTYIYGIFFGSECYYIGSTKDVDTRFNEHKKALDKCKHKNNKLQEIFNGQQGMFEVRTLYEVNDSIVNRYVAEYVFTSAYHPICNRVFNMSNGRFNWRMKLMDKNIADKWLKVIEGK